MRCDVMSVTSAYELSITLITYICTYLPHGTPILSVVASSYSAKMLSTLRPMTYQCRVFGGVDS